MKKISVFLVFCVFCLYSCSDDDDISLRNDLESLPEDNGGTHQANVLGSTTAIYGYYVYTPSEYKADGPEYPLLICLHGSGERGDSGIDPSKLNKVLVNGPPKLIEKDEWSPTYPMVVISPQLVKGVWKADEVHDFIEYCQDTYRVNNKRIYLTGLSLGGRGCFDYVGAKAEESYCAAIVPISGEGYEYYAESFKNMPVWAFHGEDDTAVNMNGSLRIVNAINEYAPIHKAKITIYPGVGHNAWPRTYDSSGMGTESPDYDPFDKIIYDWMFEYNKE